MKRVHQEIEEDLKSGAFINRLETIYGEELQHLGFWGTEPLLTLHLIEKHIPELLRRFPKLEYIGFSTSLMVFPERIVKFATSLSINLPKERALSFKVQISLDGPDFIVDTNRVVGAAKAIPKNFFAIIKTLNNTNLGKLKIQFGWKVTHTDDNINYLINNPKRFDEYFQYFDELLETFKKENKNENVSLNNAYHPTLMMPGKYTTEDGKQFAQYLQEFHKRNRLTAYTSRLNRLFKYNEELSKRHTFSCSGGDSNLGIGQNVHICHRTFYYNNDDYIESILSTDIENWDVSLFQRGTIEQIRKNYIIDINDLHRFKYVMRGYHDFWQFQLSYVKAMMTELALAGQAEDIESEELMELYALFINSCLSCPMENLLNAGSIHLQVISLMRMFGNGAFREILKSLKILWSKENK